MKPKSLLAIIFVVFSTSLFSQVMFVDITEGSGIDEYSGKSFGASWGDINGDGLMDLYSSSHYNPPTSLGPLEYPYIFVNLGEGNFSKDIYTIESGNDWDLHGGLFFDYNNDGLLDLLCLAGGNKSNIFFSNDSGLTFVQNNTAEDVYLSQEFARARMAGCLDINKDGITDIILNNLPNSDGSQPTSLLVGQEDGTFIDESVGRNFNVPSSQFSTIYDMNNNGEADLLVFRWGVDIYDVSSEVLQNKLTLTVPGASDLAIGDLNGDLLPDLFISTGREAPEITQFSPNVIRAVLSNTSVEPPYEFRFNTNGPFTLDIKPRVPKYYQGLVHVGSQLSNSINSSSYSIEIDPTGSDFFGVQNFDSEIDAWQVIVGREDATTIVVKVHNLESDLKLALTVTGTEELTGFVQESVALPNLPDLLLINNGDYTFSPYSNPPLLDHHNSFSVVMADFDNDMDLDVYVQVATTSKNRTNYMLENLGDGTFIKHEGAWGATGDGPGIGEGATTVDYNNDGFMDILTTNGTSVYYLDSAKYNLYQNLGNSNNWLKLNLVGNTSTRDAHGAIAYVYAGGVAQMRTQNAGEHNRSQNDRRLHFGLGENAVADSVHIKWPCGTLQKLINVEANQIRYVIEPTCGTTIIAPETERIRFRIYPNPSTSFYEIDWVYNPIVTQMQVINAAGQVVSKHIVTDQGNEIFRAPTVPGTYTIELLDAGGQKFGSERLIVY